MKLSKHLPGLKWVGYLSKVLQVSLVEHATEGAFLDLSTFDCFTMFSQ